MSDFRSTRIGVANAARILGVRVSDLKEAVRSEKPILGVEIPRPIGYLGSAGTEMYFYAGPIMDAAEKIAESRQKG